MSATRTLKDIGINSITVAGFKSIRDEQAIEIRPLTLLAGVNSSGKSSMMQPLLMLKQTMESSTDPGTLLINGPCVKFSRVDQFLSVSKQKSRQFSFKIVASLGGRKFGAGFEFFTELYSKKFLIRKFKILRNNKKWVSWGIGNPGRIRPLLDFHLQSYLQSFPSGDDITSIIHLPGLRGNPQRSYSNTGTEGPYLGTFEPYTASIISQWVKTKDASLELLVKQLKALGLTSHVTAKAVNDAEIEIHVGRVPKNGKKRDLVSLADVGFGVSQTLPVLVALQVARPGQLVYLEQPEIHLHPKAQTKLAGALAEAARRGVRVVAETHSALLLLGVQTLVAEDKLDPKLIKLHWFERGEDGATKITSSDLDETGAFGDWPEDFGTTELEAQRRFLDAGYLSSKLR